MARITSRIGMGWRTAAPLHRAVLMSFEDLTPRYNGQIMGWRVAKPREQTLGMPILSAAPVNQSMAVLYASASLADKHHKQTWRAAVALDISESQVWQLGNGLEQSALVPWQQATPTDGGKKQSWFYAGVTLGASVSGLYSPPNATAVVFDLGGLYSPPSPANVDFDLAIQISQAQGQPAQATDTHHRQKWSTPPALDNAMGEPWGEGVTLRSGSIDTDWEVEPGDPYSPQPDPIDIKEHYLIMNQISLKTVADDTPLAMGGFSVSMDIDSTSYSLSVELLNQASYAKTVKKDRNPVDVELSINGHKMRFIVEDGGTSQGDTATTWKASGKTHSALLSEPYAPTKSMQSVTSKDAAGAASAELIGTGITLNWPQGLQRNAINWTMPAGVWGYQDKTPMQAIKRLAEAIGAVVIPSLDGASVTVQPRWPLMPWALDSDNADVQIHESMIRNPSEDYSRGPAYDELWVSGETHGNQTRVYRADTGGGTMAPYISDPLLTENPANIQRGAQALAEYAGLEVVSFDTVVLEQGGPGIITPGQIIEVQHNDPARNWRGLVLSNDVSPGSDFVELYQSLKIARPSNANS